MEVESKISAKKPITTKVKDHLAVGHKKKNIQSIAINVLTVIGLVLTVLFTYYGYRRGIFTDEGTLNQFLKTLGIYGPMIFIVIQIIQTVIPIIPGALTCVAGVAIFGPWVGFAYNYIGIIIGSTMNFLLARRYGENFVMAFVKEEQYKKYLDWFNEKSRVEKLFALSMASPVSPADFICMFVGLTKIRFRNFFIILCLAKPFSLFIYTMGLTKVIERAYVFLKAFL